MPRVLNIGSLNADYVYSVPHFVAPGETLAACGRSVHVGGKGLNQSVALARAGVDVTHVGRIGPEGRFLKEFLADEGVDVTQVAEDGAMPSGHTVIQVTPEAENAILYFPGTNHALDEEAVVGVLGTLASDDVVLLQNETNGVARFMKKALGQNRVIFNPAPFTKDVAELPLADLYALLLNRTEALGLLEALGIDGGVSVSGEADDGVALMERLLKAFEVKGAKRPVLIVTLGAQGAVLSIPGDDERVRRIPAFPTQALDTTGAGDTFVGYAVRALLSNSTVKGLLSAFAQAALAASLSVRKAGAAESVPTADEVRAERLRLEALGAWPTAC